MKLYEYQIDLSKKGLEILKKRRLLYFHVEVRCGKTLTALEVCKLYGVKNVLFLTKLKAIGSIESDYKNFNYSNNFNITVANYESLHKIDGNFDLIVLDEAHTLGAFPKPSKRTKDIKARFSKLPMIFLSGTPAVESSSQWYHQFYVSNYSPFAQYTNFYKWSKDYVDVVQKHLGYGVVNNYKGGRTKQIEYAISQFVLKFSQEDAGFKSKVTKHIKSVTMSHKTIDLSNKLKKDHIIIGKKDKCTADTGAKLLNKLHQISGGTLILDSGESVIIDKTKAQVIKEKFNEKIAIFYYYQKELELIKEVYGDEITTDLDEFNTTDKSIVLQQYSGAEGISLKKANKLVFYNWGLSGVKFIQAIDRMTTKDRQENNVYFINSANTISNNILQRVMNKESYGVAQFKADYGKFSNKSKD